MEREGQQEAPSQQAVEPPAYEHFLLKDLDTGMKSYVTDQEWVEQPVIPQAGSPPGASPGDEQVKPRTPTTPRGMRDGKPPRGVQKRARSDELQAVHRTLRPSDQVRVVAHKKRERDFANLYRWQRVRAHHGAIRVLEFNATGRWLATAGEDTLVKIWDVDFQLEDNRANVMKGLSAVATTGAASADGAAATRVHSAYMYIRNGAPSVVFKGHTSDVTDVAWSKNNFVLSASVDRTIRLWHPHAKGCIRRLLHPDIVTSVTFHPTDEQICISGTGDGLVRMWHLKEQKMLSQAETDDLITACAITPDGTTALVGLYSGRCKFFALFDEIQAEWQFKHTTQLDVRSRRAKNSQGKKICGFRFFKKSDKVLISSNDSRIRLYRLDDKSVVCKFVGHTNSEARLIASFDPKGRYALCASETGMVHIWDVEAPMAEGVARDARSSGAVAGGEDGVGARKDAGVAHEAFVVQESGSVTGAVFAPDRVPKEAMLLRGAHSNDKTSGLVIVTSSDDGEIRVFGCC